MTVILLIFCFLFAGFAGCRIMDRVDRFLNDHVKEEKEDEDEQESSRRP